MTNFLDAVYIKYTILSIFYTAKCKISEKQLTEFSYINVRSNIELNSIDSQFLNMIKIYHYSFKQINTPNLLLFAPTNFEISAHFKKLILNKSYKKNIHSVCLDCNTYLANVINYSCEHNYFCFECWRKDLKKFYPFFCFCSKPITFSLIWFFEF